MLKLVDGLEGLDGFDLEVAVAIAGDEVVMEVNLNDESLVASELRSQRFASSRELLADLVESILDSQVTSHRK